MSESLYEFRRRDSARRRAISIAIGLSLLVHAAVLWKWVPDLRRPSSEKAERSDGRSSLSVELAPRASPPPRPRAPTRQVERPSTPQARPPRAARPPPERAARKRPSPPVIALNKPAPGISSPPPTAPSAPAPRPPPEGDLAAYVEAKRRARGESVPPAASAASGSSAPQGEDENARANRIAAANLGSDRKPTFGSDTSRGGGIFSVERLAYDYAEFLFFGWNKDIRRNTTQLIEVRKGGNSDIRIAVVRRMIVIIREHEQGDFVFESKRLGRNVTLSARARDTAGLEDFMMREFFGSR